MNAGQFKKGHESWNKGLKGYCPSPQTLFKKGHGCYWKAKAVGSERVLRDNKIEVRIANRRESGNFWILKHVLIWQTHHNQSVPKNHVIRFLDGDIFNFEISNLMLVSRAENAMLNKIKVNEALVEVRRSVYLLVKLKYTISGLKNGNL